jgi:hypothetical protein
LSQRRIAVSLDSAVAVPGTSQWRGVNLVAGSRLLRSGHAISVYHHLVILRCTRKLLRLLGTETAADPRPMPDTGDWYANLLWFDRRKCLLLTHAGTLFSVFEADVRAADLRDTHRLVTGLIARELAREGLPSVTFGLLDEQELIVAKTADRSILGCMNDMALLCEHEIAISGGPRQADLADLNQTLRRNINSARRYQRPVDLAARRVPSQHRPQQ